MSATEQIAQFALSPKLSALPSGLVKQAKGRILDTIGVTLAGSIEDCTRIAADVVYSRGSESACTVLGFPFALCATEAAFVNGVGAHALEYDDITSTAVTHTSACIVPACCRSPRSWDDQDRRFWRRSWWASRWQPV